MVARLHQFKAASVRLVRRPAVVFLGYPHRDFAGPTLHQTDAAAFSRSGSLIIPTRDRPPNFFVGDAVGWPSKRLRRISTSGAVSSVK